MSERVTWAERRERWKNARHARRAGRAKISTEFVSAPEPRTIGSFARGKQLVAGQFLFGGHFANAPDATPWALKAPDAAFLEDIHGFVWLDDLAAIGDGPARKAAQKWTEDWIQRYGDGRGHGWTPHIVGRRITRWINHGLMMLSGDGSTLAPSYFRSLAQQATFLGRRWHAAPRGLPRLEALTGVVYSGLALTNQDKHLATATSALAEDCKTLVGAEGGIASRNPQELLEVFTLLTWTASALSEAGLVVHDAHIAAIERIAPTLRALRHGDGGLARFHGGGRGLDGRLDQALATSGIRGSASEGLAMGYARIASARTTVIVDAAPPPSGDAATTGHASTLAFELTSGRRPLIVNCGSGLVFGPKWHRAGRATPSHSTLCIDGVSSSRMSSLGRAGGRDLDVLSDGPTEVRLHRGATPDTTTFMASHNGYVKSHGLTHVRQLSLSTNGRTLIGDDTFAALQERHKPALMKAKERAEGVGIPFTLRFHLHPEVDAEVDLGGSAISLGLKSGEIWVFRFRGQAQLSIEPGVFLEKGRLEPRASKQIVLSGAAIDYATRIGWTLAKAQDTPQAIRDLEREDLAVVGG
ncbi:MAG: heparinase II/III family protein [Pseudomonadota bacterium]